MRFPSRSRESRKPLCLTESLEMGVPESGAHPRGPRLLWGLAVWVILVIGALEAPAKELAIHWDPKTSPEIDVVRGSTGHLLVRPQVHGKDLGWWILDTGASGIIVNEVSSRDILVPVLGRGASEGISGQRLIGDVIQLQSLRLGPLTLEKLECLRLDLSDLCLTMKTKVAGILGYEFFAHAVVVFDFKTPSLTVHNPEHFPITDDLPWEGLITYEKAPCVWGRYDDEVGVFRVDIGAPLDTVTFHGPEARRMTGKGTDHTGSVTVRGAVGEMTLKQARLRWFKLGGARFVNPEVQLADATRGLFADKYLAGNIGGAFLRPFRVTMNMPRGKIAFERLESPLVLRNMKLK